MNEDHVGWHGPLKCVRCKEEAAYINLGRWDCESCGKKGIVILATYRRINTTECLGSVKG